MQKADIQLLSPQKKEHKSYKFKEKVRFQKRTFFILNVIKLYTIFIVIIIFFDNIEHVNIYKTFDEFLALPISLIRKRVIQILHVETNIFAKVTNVSVENFDSTTQVTVIGSKKVYNLLSTVLQKRKMMQDANKESKVHNKLS